jgi:hypothetical protein
VRGYQRGNRWGDYPAVAADPADPAKIWVMGQYAKSSTAWGTAVTTVP